MRRLQVVALICFGAVLASGAQLALRDWRITARDSVLVEEFTDGTMLVPIRRQTGERTDQPKRATAIGYRAGAGNAGDFQTAVGTDAGSGNAATGHHQTAVGKQAGQDNTGDSCTQIGYLAGWKNTGTRTTQIGYYAGYMNTGTRQVAVGDDAGEFNTGTNCTQVGENAGARNRGNQQVAMGEEAGQCNLGGNLTAIGRHAARGNQGSYNTGLGARTFEWTPDSLDSAKAVSFDDSSINVEQQTITILKHGLVGKDGWINLMLTLSGDGVPGLENGEACLFQVLDENTLKFDHPQNRIEGTGKDKGHTLTPRRTVHWSTGVGFGSTPDKSYQVMLGGQETREVKTAGQLVLKADQAIYLGDPNAATTCRLVRRGDGVAIERFNGTSWDLITSWE